MNNELSVKDTECLSIGSIGRTNYLWMIRFTNSSGDIIGELILESETLKFEGNVDESAKIFFDEVIKKHLKYMEEK